MGEYTDIKRCTEPYNSIPILKKKLVDDDEEQEEEIKEQVNQK